MEATKCIGRVGALAVALGIGTALTTGTGIAWASDGESPNAGSGASVAGGGSEDTTSTASTTRKGPLAKLGERVRNEVKSSIDRTGEAVQRTQTRMEKAQTKLNNRRAELDTKVADATKPLDGAGAAAAKGPEVPETINRPINRFLGGNTPAIPEVPAALRGTPDRPTAARVVSERVNNLPGVLPDLSPATRENAVTLKVSQLGGDLAERGREAMSTLSESVAPVRNLRLDSAPITAFAESMTTPGAATLEAPTTTGTGTTSVVSALLVAAGLSPLAGSGPLAPGQSPAVWALLAWARREFERTINPDGEVLQSAKAGESMETGEGEQIQLMSAAVQTQAATAAVGDTVIGHGQTAKPPLSGSSTSEDMGWVTGSGVTDHWYVAGTDLGIMWVGGYTSDGTPIVYTLFGDTYEKPGMTGDWRFNTLFRSTDMDLRDGLQFDDALIHAGAPPGSPPGTGTPTWYGRTGQPAGAGQIIGIPSWSNQATHTMIPTSAIAVENEDGTYTQYATFMSVRTWDNPGSWTTNYSAIAVSTDGGKTWTLDPNTVRSASAAGDKNFQQNAMVYGNPEDDDSWTSGTAGVGERYVYVYGTPAGRQGSAYVSRVPESQITDLDAYQYYAGDDANGNGKWVVGKPSEAVAVIGTEGATGSIFPETGIFGILLSPLVSFLKLVYPAGFKPGGIFSAGGSGGNVSEMSVQYNPYLDKYVVLYTDGGNNVVMRVSDSPQGTWSDSVVVQGNAGQGQNTSMYAPMIHPLSGTGDLAGGDQYLYYNLSQWNDYNVRMMRVDLSKYK